ncbi:MAG: lipoprotein-releasing ABC transporter permease subunit [Pseudohongiellaceae bacterium]
MAKFSLARHIALRYISVGKRSQLVSFISAISIFGLALSITILVTVLSVMNGFDREMRENVLGIVPHLTLITDERVSAEEWNEVDGFINQHPDVLGTAPMISDFGVVATGEYSGSVAVTGIDAGREQNVSVLSRFMIAGSLQSLQEQRWGIALGESLAELLGVGLGDQIDLFPLRLSVNPLSTKPVFRSFVVTGIYKVGAQELDSDLVLINIAAARALYQVRSPQNGLRVRLQDVLNADNVRLELLNELPVDFSLVSWTRNFGSVYDNIRLSRTIVGFLLWLLIAVAAFNLVVSLIMVVRDKKGDIAILRTLGASPKTIGRIFMLQGCLVGLIGTAIGLVLGVLASLWVSDFAAWLERMFSMQLLSADVYPIDFLPSRIMLSDLVSVAVGVVVLSVLATIYPARRAAAIQPAEALRAE